MEPQDQPQTSHQLPAPGFNGHPSPASVAQPKGAKSLAIALVMSAVFLLAAGGVAVWLLTKPGGTSTITQQPTGDGSNAVKNVTFVAPTTLPATYAPRQQDTHTASATYYFDPATYCGISTHFAPLTTELSEPKAMAVKLAESEYSYGVTTTASTDIDKIAIKDIDSQHQYDFGGVVLDQNIAVQGVPYKTQRTAVFYKQFGVSVATVGYTCSTDTWEAKKPELQQLVAAFNVKTER